MDPDAALAQIRELVGALRVVDTDDERVPELLEVVEGLDGWLSKGGALPRQWTRAGEREVP